MPVGNGEDVGTGVSVGFGVTVAVAGGNLGDVAVAGAVGVTANVEVSATVDSAARSTIGVRDGSMAAGAAVGEGAHAANTRRIRPTEMHISSTDLIMLCSNKGSQSFDFAQDRPSPPA